MADKRIKDLTTQASRLADIYIPVDKSGFTDVKKIQSNVLSPLISEEDTKSSLSSSERSTYYVRVAQGASEYKTLVNNIFKLTQDTSSVSVSGSRKIRAADAASDTDGHILISELVEYIRGEWYKTDEIDVYDDTGSTKYATLYIAVSRTITTINIDPSNNTSGLKTMYYSGGGQVYLGDSLGNSGKPYLVNASSDYILSQSKDPNTGFDNMVRVYGNGAVQLDIDEKESGFSITYINNTFS